MLFHLIWRILLLHTDSILWHVHDTHIFFQILKLIFFCDIFELILNDRKIISYVNENEYVFIWLSFFRIFASWFYILIIKKNLGYILFNDILNLYYYLNYEVWKQKYVLSLSECWKCLGNDICSFTDIFDSCCILFDPRN